MERSRLVHAILTRGIHARPDVNNMVDFNTKLFIISLTFFRDFLSLETENTLFFNDVERNLYFFSQLFVFILGANERKSGLLRKLPDWQEPVLSVLRTRAYAQTSPAGQFSLMVSALGFQISRYSRS